MHIDSVTIAKLCHKVNRAYCISMGDMTQASWAKAPDWQKASAIRGVEFHLANPKATPEDSHLEWMRTKVEEGWVYGEVKDVDKKQHPCLRPYQELPDSQKAKDYIFSAICEFFGYDVYSGEEGLVSEPPAEKTESN